jgi:hypothetical protein
MKVLTARVVDGRLEVPEGALQEGDTVTLLLPDLEGEGFHLSAEQQEKLRAAIADAERGQTLDGWQLLEELKS